MTLVATKLWFFLRNQFTKLFNVRTDTTPIGGGVDHSWRGKPHLALMSSFQKSLWLSDFLVKVNWMWFFFFKSMRLHDIISTIKTTNGTFSVFFQFFFLAKSTQIFRVSIRPLSKIWVEPVHSPCQDIFYGVSVNGFTHFWHLVRFFQKHTGCQSFRSISQTVLYINICWAKNGKNVKERAELWRVPCCMLIPCSVYFHFVTNPLLCGTTEPT